jgi:hypothetical protein
MYFILVSLSTYYTIKIYLAKCILYFDLLRGGLMPCPNLDRVRQEFLQSLILAYFFLPPFSLLLFYFKVSCEGKFRNRKEYAKLVYFKPISKNSGIQKWMA